MDKRSRCPSASAQAPIRGGPQQVLGADGSHRLSQQLRGDPAGLEVGPLGERPPELVDEGVEELRREVGDEDVACLLDRDALTDVRSERLGIVRHPHEGPFADLLQELGDVGAARAMISSGAPRRMTSRPIVVHAEMMARGSPEAAAAARSERCSAGSGSVPWRLSSIRARTRPVLPPNDL